MAVQARGGAAQNFSWGQRSTLRDQHVILWLESCTHRLWSKGEGEIATVLYVLSSLTLTCLPCFGEALSLDWLKKELY